MNRRVLENPSPAFYIMVKRLSLCYEQLSGRSTNLISVFLETDGSIQTTAAVRTVVRSHVMICLHSDKSAKDI